MVEDWTPAIRTTVPAIAGDGREPFQDAAHAEDVAAIQKLDGHFWVFAAEEEFRADGAVHIVSVELGRDQGTGFGEELVEEDGALGAEVFILGA